MADMISLSTCSVIVSESKSSPECCVVERLDQRRTWYSP